MLKLPIKQLINNFITKLHGDFAVSFFANIFSYLVSFCGSIIYVRMLGKEHFGLYTFAFNIVSLFLLVNGLGAATGVLQYVSKAKNSLEEENYLRFAFWLGTFFNFIISILIIIYALCVSLPMPQAKPILLAMALFPVGRLYMDVYQAYLRAMHKNILQAKFLLINNCILLFSNIIGIVFFNLYGLVYSTYIGYLIMFTYSTWKFDLPPLFKFYNIIYIDIKQFIIYSFFVTMSNTFSGLLYVLDVIIIGYVIKSPSLIASYRVATIIPFAINFIPGIILSYYYPTFVKNSHDSDKIKYLSRWISVRMFWFSGCVSIFLILAAKPIILIIFGDNYCDSIVPFQIISFGYWIVSSFRSVNGNILAALGKAKLSFYLTFIALLLNIVVTYFMVKYYFINGAAVSIVLMYLFSSFMGYVALKLVLHKIKLGK